MSHSKRFERMKEVRKMKYVQRLSSKPLIKPYSLAEHSFYTAQLFAFFCEEEGNEYDGKDLELVMNHDLLETRTGDLLWTAKSLSRATVESWNTIESEVAKKHDLTYYTDVNIKSKLGEKKFKIFKASDYMELLMFVSEEISLGNNSVEIKEVYDNCRYLISELKIKTATKMMEEL